jgi:predicted dehydrogenase
MKNQEVLLIGSGYMAEEYLKVLKELGVIVTIVGRGVEKITKLKEKYPEFNFHSGGLEKFLNSTYNYPKTAINTVNVEFLRITTEQLLNAGVNKILLEKPGDLTVSGLSKLADLATDKSAQLFIAYNRRFYTSVNELQNQTNLDGGILSAHFEFTEWIHTIDPALYEKDTLKRWIIANSSHVIDTVFHLIGIPKSINSIVSGQNAISWHPSGSIFIGSGISAKDIPFTYHTNWQAPGRWAIEVLTKKHRLYLKPMETLQIQNIGSVAINAVEIDNRLDIEFKPGLYLQTKAFLEGDFTRFCTIQQQQEYIETFYLRMSGY